MEGFTRFIGIGLLLGLFAVSVLSYQETLQTLSSETEDQELALSIEEASSEDEPNRVDASESSSEPPLLLGFVDGYRPGHYTIEYAPRPQNPNGENPDGENPDGENTGTENTDTEVPEPDEGGMAASEVVPGTMPPGLYATAFGVEDCSYQIRRITWQSRTSTERVIGQDYLAKGRLLVSFNDIEPDVFTSRPACGGWVPWSAAAEPLTVAENGDYWVGDLAKGAWNVPEQCMWEKVVAFRGAELVDIQQSGVSPQQLIVDDETLGVRVRGCPEPLELLAG